MRQQEAESWAKKKQDYETGQQACAAAIKVRPGRTSGCVQGGVLLYCKYEGALDRARVSHLRPAILGTQPEVLAKGNR